MKVTATGFPKYAFYRWNKSKLTLAALLIYVLYAVVVVKFLYVGNISFINIFMQPFSRTKYGMSLSILKSIEFKISKLYDNDYKVVKF